jgi:hypothetical protein
MKNEEIKLFLNKFKAKIFDWVENMEVNLKLWNWDKLICGRSHVRASSYDSNKFNQQDATVSQVYYLTFMCGSTCFGRLLAHHQERTPALGASGSTYCRKNYCFVLICKIYTTIILMAIGRTRGSQCRCMLLMMGGETPETCWATHKRQVINLWNCCILLVELFESSVVISLYQRWSHNLSK